MDCENSKPDIAGLKKFSSRILTKDRGSTPFFSGRHQIIEDIELSIEGVMERYRNRMRMPASDETWLLQGPPGVGKSALLARLDERWSSEPSEAAPITLPIRVDLICNQANLVAGIAEAIAIANNDADASGKLRKIVSIDHSIATSVGHEFLLNSTAQSSGGKSVTTKSRELTWETLAALFPPEKWKRPVVLMLDEVQSMRDLEGQSEVSNLHQGIHGLPIIPIFAGLLDSYDALRKHHISRMSSRRRVTLGALEQSEAESSVKRMLDTFRVDSSNRCDWARRIAGECSGWPQHLHTNLQALAKVLAANNGMLGPTDGDFARSVSEISATYRNEYYEDRLDDDLVGCVGLLHIVLDSARPPGKTLAELNRAIAIHAKDSEDCKYQLPENVDASGLLNRMIMRGFLQRSGNSRRYFCPIPSLTGYIGELARD